MAPWFWYAVVAAVLYGAHQIFTRMAADHIGEGLGGFVVEATAALSILVYLAFLWLASRWNQQSSAQGIFYSVLTGVCVGGGTIAFFLLFQKGGPLSSVPAILAGGAAIMAIAGILFFHEPPSWLRLLGVAFAIVGFVFGTAIKLRGRDCVLDRAMPKRPQAQARRAPPRDRASPHVLATPPRLCSR